MTEYAVTGGHPLPGKAVGVAADLRALARARLERGELPRERPSRVVGGLPSLGARCALCGDPISGTVEVRATTSSGILHFHGRCHWAWDIERETPR